MTEVGTSESFLEAEKSSQAHFIAIADFVLIFVLILAVMCPKVETAEVPERVQAGPEAPGSGNGPCSHVVSQPAGLFQRIFVGDLPPHPGLFS